MAIDLQDVFAVMQGEKEIRDVTDPAVADAITGKPIDDVLKIGEKLQSVPEDTPVVAKIAPETGGAAFTDEEGAESLQIGGETKGVDEAQQLQLQQVRQQARQRVDAEKAAIATTPKELKESPAKPLTPLSSDPDILKNTAFKYTVGVSKQSDKQAFYSAHAMLSGQKAFNADDYLKARRVLQAEAQRGNKGASYFLNEFDTYFATKASEFIPAALLSAMTARDPQDAQVRVMRALSDVFGGDNELQEAFLRSGGMEVLMQTFNRAGITGTVQDTISAENLMLERDKLRAGIESKRSAAAATLRGGQSYAPTGTVAYDPAAAGPDKEAFVKSVDTYAGEGSGGTVLALNDFKEEEQSRKAPAKDEIFVFQDIADVIDTVSQGTYESSQQVRSAIVDAYVGLGNDLEDGSEQALFRAVISYDGGHAFDSIGKGIIDTANQTRIANDIRQIEQWANLDDDGDVQGLSAAIDKRGLEYFAGFYDKAYQTEGVAAMLDGIGAEAVDSNARIAATKAILSEISGGNGDYLLPVTEEQLSGAPKQIQEIYGLIGGKLDEVQAERKGSKIRRINTANAEYDLNNPGQRTGNWIQMSIGDSDFIAPLEMEAVINEGLSSKDPEARALVEKHIVDGQFNRASFDSANPGMRRWADTYVDIDGADGDKTKRTRAFLREVSDDTYRAYTNPDMYFAETLAASTSQEHVESLSAINKIVEAWMIIESSTSIEDRDFESGWLKLKNLTNPKAMNAMKILEKYAEPLLEMYRSGSEQAIHARYLLQSGNEENAKRGLAMLLSQRKATDEENIRGGARGLMNSFAEYYGVSGGLTNDDREEFFDKFKRDLSFVYKRSKEIKKERDSGEIDPTEAHRQLSQISNYASSYSTFMSDVVAVRYESVLEEYKDVTGYLNVDQNLALPLTEQLNEIIFLNDLSKRAAEVSDPGSLPGLAAAFAELQNR